MGWRDFREVGFFFKKRNILLPPLLFSNAQSNIRLVMCSLPFSIIVNTFPFIGGCLNQASLKTTSQVLAFN